MSTENKEKVPAIPPKKKGRGISNETRSVSQRKFHNDDRSPNFNLFLGQLEDVKLTWITIKETAQGMATFRGQAIPKLSFHFTSTHKLESDKRHVYKTFNPVESNVDTIPGGQYEWQVTGAFAWIKHLLEVYYLKGRPMTEEEEALLVLPYEDFDDDGMYVAVEPEAVINGWKILFENIERMFNTGKEGKPVYKDANGASIAVWMKLIRFYKSKKNGWKPAENGDIAFPTFVGEGCIEVFYKDKAPNMKFNPINETLDNIQVNKAPNTPIVPGGPSFVDPSGATNMGGYGAGMPTGTPADDLPF